MHVSHVSWGLGSAHTSQIPQLCSLAPRVLVLWWNWRRFRATSCFGGQTLQILQPCSQLGLQLCETFFGFFDNSLLPLKSSFRTFDELQT